MVGEATRTPIVQEVCKEIDDYNLNPVSLSYEFAGGQPKTSDLFTVGSAFPLTKSITFDKKAGNLKMMLQYQDGGHILEGLPK